MEKFKYGIIAVDMNDVDEDDNAAVVHFVGYWEEPNEATFDALREEFETDESLGLKDIINDLELLPAPPEVVDHFNEILEADGVFNDNPSLN